MYCTHSPIHSSYFSPFFSMSTCFIIFAFLLSVSPCVLSQQNYYSTRTTEDCTVHHPENAGYVCNASTPRCNNTVAYFRVQSGNYATLNAISNQLFNMSPAAVATASGLSSSAATVSVGQGLYIPLDCTCYGNHSSQNVSYTIQPGDTFLKVANHTYEGLTTCQAIQDENPKLVVTNLQIGQVVTMPIRCACPSAQQISRGIVSLVTYPVADGDTISSVVNMFGITLQEFLVANTINSSAPLFPATTILLPFLVKPTNPPNATSSLSPPPLSQPSSP
eukprot:c25286_g3_i1 orf=491-1321(+)